MQYLAAGELRIGNTTVQAPSQVPTGGIAMVETILQNGFNVAMIFLILFALGSMLWSGLQMLMSEGDKQKFQNGRRRLIFSVIGLVIVFMSFFIINVVSFVFNVSFFH